MRPRIAIIGFDRETVENFEKENLNIVSHIYGNSPDKHKTYPDRPDLINFHLWKQYRSRGSNNSTNLSLLSEVRDLCFDDFIKSTDRWDWSRQLVQSWVDYNHLLRLALGSALEWFESHKPDLLVFSNVPHQGIAIVYYHVAKLLGIKTRIFIQSPFVNRVWYLDDWKDLGNFTSSIETAPFPIDITPPQKPPFYMNNVRSDFVSRCHTSWHLFRAKLLLTTGVNTLSRENSRENTLRNMGRWQRALENRHHNKISKTAFNGEMPDEPFVYFPLHLQPEMTTDVLGGIYTDQLLALEKLRELVPSDIKIVVKENPKQTGQMRSPLFFSRLSKVPNIIPVSENVSSFDLIEQSLAVATITGTAGWEALRMGKPAIVFGAAFWKNLAGAFNFDSIRNWNDITSFSFNRKSLERAVLETSKHAHLGVCDLYYTSIVDDFDPQQNAKNLASIIKKQLGPEPSKKLSSK